MSVFLDALVRCFYCRTLGYECCRDGPVACPGELCASCDYVAEEVNEDDHRP